MAEFVTKKESQRRLFILIFCVIADTFALLAGIYAIKGSNDLEEKGPKSLKALNEKLREKRTSNDNLEASYKNFSRQVGWNYVSGGTADRMATAGVNGDQLRGTLDSWVRDQFPKLGITGFSPWDQQAEGEKLTLLKLLDKLNEKEQELRNKIAQLEGERTAAAANDATLRTEIDNSDKALTDDLDRAPGGLREQYKQLLKQLTSKEKANALELDGDGSSANRGLAGEVYDKQAALTELRNNIVRVKAQVALVKRDLENRINWIVHRQEEAKERKEPDGEILAVYPQEMIAYIDLVHADRIHRGSIFKVYTLEKGGVKVDKGRVEVLEVGREGYSRVAMYPANADDPIKRGDRIYDEYYERGKSRSIAIAGRLTGKLSNEEAVKQIKAFGDSYQEKVDEKTNYVIVGEGYEDHPNFKAAQEWGVKVLLERAFYQYVGIP